MGLMSSKVEREKLTPGDHIYTWRSGYSYSHHGIYMGDGKVVHLTRGPGWVISSSSRSQPSDDRVVCSNIQDFLCDEQLYRFEYGVSEIQFVIKRAGTCLRASSNPREQVLHCASYLLENGVGEYHLLNKNCEDFAIYCKIGFVKKDTSGQAISLYRTRVGGYSQQASSLYRTQVGGYSQQASFLITVVIAILVFPRRFLPATLIGQALMFCGWYYFLKLFQAFGSQRILADEQRDRVIDEHNVRQFMYTNMMERTSTRWFLPGRMYIRYSLCAIYMILVLLDIDNKHQYLIFGLCLFLIDFVTAHLTLYGFKRGDNLAYAIFTLGYLCWGWTSERTPVVFASLLVLYGSLLTSFPNDARSSKLNSYAPIISFGLVNLYWNQSAIFQLIKFFHLCFCYVLSSGK